MVEPTKNDPTYLPGQLNRRLAILREMSEATCEEWPSEAVKGGRARFMRWTLYGDGLPVGTRCAAMGEGIAQLYGHAV